MAKSREAGEYDGEVQKSRDLYDLAELYDRAGDQAKAAEIYGARPTIRYFETPIVVDNAAGQIVEEAA